MKDWGDLWFGLKRPVNGNKPVRSHVTGVIAVTFDIEHRATAHTALQTPISHAGTFEEAVQTEASAISLAGLLQRFQV